MNNIGKHLNESHFSRSMYISLRYLGYLSMFIIYNVPSAVINEHTPHPCPMYF